MQGVASLTEQAIVALIAIAVIVNIILVVGLLAPATTRSRARRGPRRLEPSGVRTLEAAVVGGVADPDEDQAEPGYDRIVRIVSWVFLLTTATIVLVTGLWPDTQTAILILLALAGLFVIVFHDVLPTDVLGSTRFIVEGSVALSGAAVLVALTGGVASPFFFTVPLIVAGAAFVVTPAETAGLTVVAALAFMLAVLIGSPPGTIDSAAVAVVSVDLVALVLLVYVAMFIAREQRSARDAAIRLSTIDPLTGLFNRAFFFAAIEREMARSARSGRGFCLLMMDLDGLKEINDRLGHFHGDRVLRAVSEVIESGVRRIDTAARYGGDEFVVLLPETDPTGGFVLAEKIRLGVRAMPIELPGGGPRPSLSVGVVSYPSDGRTVDELMISADGAMYASKRAGKDRVTGIQVPLSRVG
jgi:diguanylate cyclase (GGDEF)-like protein